MIAVICYSVSLRAVSVLFFTVLYKHQSLLTWHTHRILLIFNWVIGFLVAIPPVFVDGGYGFEEESHSCVISNKK